MNFSQLIYIFIIAAGSVLGANLRFIMLSKFSSINLSKSKRLLLINLVASLILGISLSSSNAINSQIHREIFILFLIGFSGSLSTFSSFINDLFNLSIKRKYKDAAIIILLSLFLGLISVSFGLFLGNF